jgi:uncharacterized membrane protein
MRQRLAQLARDRSGNVAIMMAGALAMLIGCSALAVDTGSLYLDKRKLQGAADAAALAAAGDENYQSGAQAALGDYGPTFARIGSITPGSYTPDPAVSPDARFTPGATYANAVDITVERDSPLYFGAGLLGRSSTPISAHARAAKIDLAAFSIGSRLASLQGGLPNALLSGLAGTNLNLSVMDYNALVSGNLDVLAFTDALRTQLHLTGLSYSEVLATQVSLPVFLRAMAAATTSASASATLQRLAGLMPNTIIVPGAMIDLGPVGGDTSPNGTSIIVDAFSMLREVLTLSNGARQLTMDLGANVPGLASTKVSLIIGSPMANSPWLAVGPSGNASVYTAQTRLLVDTSVGANLLGSNALLHIPLVIELASAKASLSSVQCAKGRIPQSVALAVTPSIGQADIGTVDPSAFANLNMPLSVSPTILVSLPLVRVTAQSVVKLGGASAQTVTFDANDIANHDVQTVSTNDLVNGLAASLISNVQLQVSVLGLGLPLQGLVSTLGSVLQLAAPVLDGVLNQLTALLGVGLGQADVRIDGVRCGAPVLVG